jgi:hypothetical protein
VWYDILKLEIAMCQCQCKPIITVDPNQLQFSGFETRFKDKFLEGYETGINWDANWMPGGPWVYSGPDIVKRKDSSIAAEQWLTGFNEGLAMRLKTNEHFATWWNRNKGKSLYAKDVTIDEVRYKDPENVNV